MYIIKYIILLQLLIIAEFSYTQSHTDSIRVVWEDESQSDSVRFDALEKYYKLYSAFQPDTTLIYLDYYHQLAIEKNAQRQVYRALNQKANIYQNKREFDKALKHYNEAALLAEKIDNKVLHSIVTGNIGNVFFVQQEYVEANRRYSAALKVFQEHEDNEGEARMLTSLGAVNSEIGNYKLALEYYQKSLDISSENKIEASATATTFMNIGWIQFKNEAYHDAKSSFEKALNLLKIDKNKYLTAYCYKLLARIHLELNQLDKANVFAQKALKLDIELQVESSILLTEIIIAQIVYETNTDIATYQAELILNKLPQKTANDTKMELYELLYKCYKSQNKLGLSLKMHELFNLYQDSLQIESSNYAAAREIIKSDYERRLYETKLKSKKEKAELEFRQLKITFGIVLISVIVISLFTFYFISLNKKNKEKRDQLLDKIKILKENSSKELVVDPNKFQLRRERIDSKLDRNLNETDWKVLNILLDDPAITNKEIAEKAHMSIDGIGSSLRRMHEYFEIKESKYKKITLLLEAIKISNSVV